jgi:poly(3-hydroxybutyrate) depolymerase
VATSLLAATLARAADGPLLLTALPVDPASVTVSGISAGGAMAVQFHIAYSKLVQGMAALAAPPYFCAEGNVVHALGRCMKDGTAIPLDAISARTAQFAADGTIDSLDGLRGDRIWAYRGAADPVVHSSVADALERQYQSYVDPAGLVRIERDGAGHTFPVADPAASACGASEPPYISNCNFDAARALLAHLYGSLETDDAAAAESGELRAFDQRPYAQASGSAGLDDRGWIYVPTNCAAAGPGQRCRLHVVFHGCRQGASFVGEDFMRRAGYLRVAQANDIVVLFPQIRPTTAPLNPLGCWDWWGYEDEHYATQRGRQIKAVRAMIADLITTPAPAR